MKLVRRLVLTVLLAFEFVSSVISIPHIETKTWIRTRRNSLRNCLGPDCLTQDEGNVEKRNCPMERAERQRLAQLTQSIEYIPSCRRDGVYAGVQCHPGTKYCWCVTLNGIPITGSTVFNNKPDCVKHRRGAKSVTIMRRSSSVGNGKKRRRTCNHQDRTRFNTALLKTFRSEFSRIRLLTSLYQDLDPNNDVVVLTWKFDHLDRNKDSLLHKNETDNLKRLVKQQIPPRPCANSFVPFCAKGDKKITKLEWLDCLKVEEIQNLPFETFNSLVDSASRSTHPFQLLRPVPGSTGLTPPTSPNLKNSDPVVETSNCWTDRQSALTSQQLDSNKSIIIPECLPNGHYQRTQCAHGRSYCWCVNETTGLEIPDTVTVNSIPNCDKPMAGCLGKKKIKFLEDLLEVYTKMMTQGDTRRYTGSRNLTLEDQVAKWNFQRLDENGNGFLDRREWKTFKSETAANSKLQKCGKKFPRHCDVNKDKKITLIEWTNCLQIKQEINSSRRTSQRSSGGPRIGKNPFTTILQR